MKSFFLLTFGCQTNISDSQRIQALLQKKARCPAKDKLKADLVIINTCGVRQAPEDRVYGIVPQIRRKNPRAKIIITGCIARRKDVQKRLERFKPCFIPILEMPQYLNRLLDSGRGGPKEPKKSNGRGGQIKSQKQKLNRFSKIKPSLDPPFSASIPIMNGCNNFCSYCVVPYARGREISLPAAEIIKQAKNFIKQGVKEIILLGQNVNSYQPPNPGKIKDFPDLLQAVSRLPGDFIVRFITSHPKDMTQKIIKTIARCPKIAKHIHLPFQAGSDKILKKMNRGYTQKHYLNLIKKIRRAIPQASITTDVIVGFPGETQQDFHQSKRVMESARFDLAYISQYSPRPRTAAFSLKDNVEKSQKKKRKQILTQILGKTALENNKKYLGKTVTVLIEKKDPRSPIYFGKTPAYKKVKIKKDRLKTGRFYKVKITQARDFGLEGEVVKQK